MRRYWRRRGGTPAAAAGAAACHCGSRPCVLY
jgi:hypothetical protein